MMCIKTALGKKNIKLKYSTFFFTQIGMDKHSTTAPAVFGLKQIQHTAPSSGHKSPDIMSDLVLLQLVYIYLPPQYISGNQPESDIFSNFS